MQVYASDHASQGANGCRMFGGVMVRCYPATYKQNICELWGFASLSAECVQVANPNIVLELGIASSAPRMSKSVMLREPDSADRRSPRLMYSVTLTTHAICSCDAVSSYDSSDELSIVTRMCFSPLLHQCCSCQRSYVSSRQSPTSNFLKTA